VFLEAADGLALHPRDYCLTKTPPIKKWKGGRDAMRSGLEWAVAHLIRLSAFRFKE
jgi:hypothetical protein